MSLDPHILQMVLEGAPGGILICEQRDGQWITIFANPPMEQLTGYSASELIGRNPGFLAGEKRQQGGLDRLREAIHAAAATTAIVRNYRSDGSQFWNEVHLRPLRNPAGQVTHFASFHQQITPDSTAAAPDSGDPMMSTQSMMAYLRDDKLTGLMRRPYFDELVQRDWSLAQRESKRLSLILFDLDQFMQYRSVFGQLGADQCFRRIARVVTNSFRRASDLCGRFDEDQIAALAMGLDVEQASRLAETVLTRIRSLAIHHPRSTLSRYVTASAGVVSIVPPQNATPQMLFDAALNTLSEAKCQGRNRLVALTADR